MEYGLLIIRLALGLTLAAHGAQKLFGWFGGGGLSGTGAAMESMGFVPGRRAAFFAGLAEGGGGILLAAGLLTPLATTAMVAVMLVAIVTAHLSNGFFAQDGGYEYPMVLGLGSLGIAFTGPGSLSLDSVIGLDLAGIGWGLAALAAGVVAGSSQLVMRKQPVPSQ